MKDLSQQRRFPLHSNTSMKKYIPFSVIALVMLALAMAFQPDIKPAAATPVEETGSASVETGQFVMVNDNLVDINKLTSWSEYEAAGLEMEKSYSCATAAGLAVPDCDIQITYDSDCFEGGYAIRKQGSGCCNSSHTRPPYFAGGYCYECSFGGGNPVATPLT